MPAQARCIDEPSEPACVTAQGEERRLLEVDDDEGLLGVLPLVAGKVVDWFSLNQESAEASTPANFSFLESARPSDVARDHDANWEVYRSWLVSQGLDPDQDMA